MENTVTQGTTYIILPPTTQTQGIKILVVDKDDSVLKLALRLLTPEGYDVETTPDPILALEKTKDSTYDILLTELNLPKMDGLALAEKFRQANPQISTLFMAEQESLETARYSVKKGSNDLILKPIDSRELLQAVKKAVKRRLEDTRIASAKELGYLTQLGDVILKSGEKKSVFKISLGFALSSVTAECGLFFHWEKDLKSIILTFGSILKDKKFEVNELPVEEDLDYTSDKRDEILETNQPEKIPVLQYLLQKQLNIPWINQFGKPSVGLVYVPVTFSPNEVSAIVLKLKSGTSEINEYEKNLLYVDAQFTSLALGNIELLNNSKMAYKELQYLHEQSIELERLASKGNAVTEMAHELNNLLSIVTGQLELSEKTLAGGNLSLTGEHLAKATETLKKTTLFVGGLLDQRKLSSEKEPCDLNRILEEVVAYAKVQSKFKYIEIVKSLQPDMPKINIDITQMKQVFYNLLNNAADAMGKRWGEGGKIFLKTKFDAEKHFIHVEVEDSGVGITPEILPYILKKPFTTKSGGHGFGLVISKRIVDSHGGTIEIDSKPLQGTVVKLKFPV